MKLRIASDLHTEFWSDNGNENKLLRQLDWALPTLVDDKDSILILAGDTFAMSDKRKVAPVMRILYERFSDVVAICGNHEYWGASVEESEDFYKDFSVHSNVVLYNKPTRIVGATLWTDFNRKNPLTMLHASQYMRDYERIKGFTAEECLKTHEEDMQLLKDFVNEGSIVVTHHAPSYKSVGKQFEGQESNAYYCSSLEETIEELKPKLWIHGHIHSTSDYTIANTRVVCNPHGYKGYERTGYKNNLIIEV